MEFAPCGALPGWGGSYVFDPEGFAAALVPQLVVELRPLSRLQDTFRATSAAISLANARLCALQSTQALATIAAKGASSSGRERSHRRKGNASDSSGGEGSSVGTAFKVMPLAPVKALELTLHAMEDALAAHFESVQSGVLRSAEPACRAAATLLQNDCLVAAAEVAEVCPQRHRVCHSVEPSVTCIHSHSELGSICLGSTRWMSVFPRTLNDHLPGGINSEWPIATHLLIWKASLVHTDLQCLGFWLL